LLLFPNPLLLFSHYSQQENIVNACYTAASVNIQHSVAGKRQQRLYVMYRQIRVFRQQQQINYTIRALIRASVTTAHFHHMEQTGSRFTPHPLLLHGNTFYYSQIILNFLLLLLFSELFWHNYLRPSWMSLLWERKSPISHIVIFVLVELLLSRLCGCWYQITSTIVLATSNYDKIWSENRQLNALFTRQQKDKEKRRARDEALKEARDKARVDGGRGTSGCERQVWQEATTRHAIWTVLRLQAKKVLDTLSAPFHSISWHTFSSVCTQLSWIIKDY